MRKKFIFLLLLGILASCSNNSDSKKINFGTLPVIQALPIFVANDLGLYQKNGVEVDIIKFNSALESEIAITTDQIDGYFADIVTPIILTANGTVLKIVSTLFQTDSTQRMFALLAPPNNPNLTIKSMAEDGIAISSNTVIDYLTPFLLNSVDKNVFDFNKIDTKKIPIRLQLLLQNKVAAAVLPEPLASFAEQSGAIIIADDRKLNMAPTVAAFRSDYLEKNHKKTQKFLSAISEAIDIINNNPNSVRDIMLQNCQVPEIIKNTYPVPHFPKLALPSHKNMQNVQNWMLMSDVIENSIEIDDLLTDEFIK